MSKKKSEKEVKSLMSKGLNTYETPIFSVSDLTLKNN